MLQVGQRVPREHGFVVGGGRNSTLHALNTPCGAATDATTGGRYPNTAGIGRGRLRHAADAHAIWRPGHAPNVQLSRDQIPLHRPEPCRANWLTLGRKRGATCAGATDSQPTPTGMLSSVTLAWRVGSVTASGCTDPTRLTAARSDQPAHAGTATFWRSAGPGWLAGQSRRGPMRPFRGWSSRVPPLLCAGVEP